MDFSWSEEQLSLKRSMVKFAQEQLNEGLIDQDGKGEFSRDRWRPWRKVDGRRS